MDVFNFIKSNVSILDVVKQYANIKKAGLYWKGHCPFHHEKTASFTVSPHREIFYCFGCSSGGDVITFISKVEQCSAIDAVKLIADRYNIDLPEESIAMTNTGTADEKDRYFQLCNLVATWCQEQLEKSSHAREYLTSRNISKESITHFTIGFFPGGLASVQSLIKYAQKNNILADDLVKAHILSQSKHVFYSPFENRIIFPIKDHLGRFCGFGGRVFKADDTRAKYYNSRENNYFAKSSLLFGFDLAKQAIQKTNDVFLVEGYTDCVAMYQYGYTNTIATLGTACTQEHLQLISRYAERLYILYDGDSAGTQAILRLTTLCWQAEVELTVLRLPKADDPASYLETHGSIDKLIKNSKDIFDFFVDTIAHDFHAKSLKQKILAARKIVAIIAQLNDGLKQDILIQRASKVLDLPFESLKTELKQTRVITEHTKKTDDPDPAPNTSYSIDQVPTLEKRIFFAIMHNMQLITQENKDYILTCLPGPLSTIMQKLYDKKGEPGAMSFNLFFNQLDDQSKHIVSKLLVSFDSPVSDTEFEQLLVQLQKKHWKRIVKTITTKLEHAKESGDQVTVNNILQRFIKLKKQMTRGLI